MGARNKSRGCKRYRPGKETSTLRKQKKQLDQLRKQFYKTGMASIIAWENLMNKVSLTCGTSGLWEVSGGGPGPLRR